MTVMEYRITVTRDGKPGVFPMPGVTTDYGRMLIEYRRLQADHPDWHLEFESRQIGVWRLVEED